MSKLNELKAKVAALDVEIEKIDTQASELLAIAEPTAEQLAQAEQLNTQSKALVAERKRNMDSWRRERDKIARDQERADMDAASLAAEREEERRNLSTPTSPGRKTDPDQPTRVGPVREAAASDPKKGFKNPREYLMAIMQASMTQGQQIDPRLRNCSYASGGPESLVGQRHMVVGSDEARGISDPAGGFLIPEGFSPDLMMVDPEDDPMGPYVRKIPLNNPTVHIPARVDKNHTTSVSGGLLVTRRPETVLITSSQIQFEQIVMKVNNLFGLSFATEEILTDSPITFIALLEMGFSEQFTFQYIKERLTGTGVGEFEGVLNSPCLVTVNKEVGQTSGTLNIDNVLKMRSRCWGYQKAIWIANHDTIPQLGVLNQSVGTGGSGMIWLPSLREDVPDLLMGRPIVFSEYAKPVGTAGDLLLGNWGEYLEGTYQPMQSAESIHVRFLNHERAFKFWVRNDGRCWWRTALTPNQSSATLSPFVVLQTR